MLLEYLKFAWEKIIYEAECPAWIHLFVLGTFCLASTGLILGIAFLVTYNPLFFLGMLLGLGGILWGYGAFKFIKWIIEGYPDA